MQLLSQVALTTPLNFPLHPRFQEFLQRPEAHRLATLDVIQLIILQVVTILAYWLASKPMAPRDKSTPVNAIILWLSYLSFGSFLGAAVGLLLPLAAAMALHDQFRALMIVGGTALASILIVFLIPMKLYVIEFHHAILLLLLAAAITVGFMAVETLAVLKTTGADKDIATLRSVIYKPGRDPQKFLRRLAGDEAPDEIDRLLDDALDPIGPQPSLAEREAKVRELQLKLQARSRTFSPGAPAPREFTDQLTRYKQFLAEVTADIAAAREAAPPAAAPAH